LIVEAPLGLQQSIDRRKYDCAISIIMTNSILFFFSSLFKQGSAEHDFDIFEFKPFR
jgi:hypothetical protein